MKDAYQAHQALLQAWELLEQSMAALQAAVKQYAKANPESPPDDLPEGVKREHEGISFVDGTTGVPWLVRLSNGEVQFWDRRHPHSPDLQAQFVSSYYASTVRRTTGGLNLSGGVPDWCLDSRSMDLVRIYLLKD